ncbi:MAG: GNAT family N-acetyltransferase [Candidatus Methanoperedens sp.]|nr:GNAT family N-acetyltransferase [Candidatus Methanoperedens sp.]MCZ7358960.1 GNAT family N-acetyltransferase [Candidatus Methanoperedens sp.]HLB70788.1 GNAT family N-acetyltransferase [Candidatus Methanoperedens sp.]
MDRSPDITARYRIYDNWKVLVAEEEGKIVGWAGFTVKQNPVQGNTYIYAVEVVVHPEFRRKGIATALLKGVDQNDPMFEIIRQFEPRIDMYDVIIKAIKGDLPDIGRFYFDFRDMAP